jgi:hypothetical protein
MRLNLRWELNSGFNQRDSLRYRSALFVSAKEDTEIRRRNFPAGGGAGTNGRIYRCGIT